MSIQDIKAKIKLFTKLDNFNIKEDVFIILAIILIGLAGFGLGKLSALEKGRESVTIKPANFTAVASSIVTPVNTEIQGSSASAMIAGESTKGMLVASKNGTKYYFPWCPGVSKINEANKIWFDSYESAKKAGLSAAANCPNLK
jgi:hypothetical protein